MKLNSKLSILIISAVTSLTATSCMISTATSKNEATSIYDVNTSYKSLSVRSAIKVEYRHDIDKLQIIADHHSAPTKRLRRKNLTLKCRGHRNSMQI